jgi:hypothetical protein
MDKLEQEMQEVIRTLADLEKRVARYEADTELLGAMIEDKLRKK